MFSKVENSNFSLDRYSNITPPSSEVTSTSFTLIDLIKVCWQSFKVINGDSLLIKLKWLFFTVTVLFLANIGDD